MRSLWLAPQVLAIGLMVVGPLAAQPGPPHGGGGSPLQPHHGATPWQVLQDEYNQSVQRVYHGLESTGVPAGSCRKHLLETYRNLKDQIDSIEKDRKNYSRLTLPERAALRNRMARLTQTQRHAQETYSHCLQGPIKLNPSAPQDNK
jgi:hypothetical protein